MMIVSFDGWFEIKVEPATLFAGAMPVGGWEQVPRKSGIMFQPVRRGGKKLPAV